MQNLQALLRFLIHSPIDFVLVGGFAAVLHGSNQVTRDIDICIVYTPERINDLRELLRPLNPRHRMDELKTSFLEFPQDLSRKQDFHLSTDLGLLDVISEVEGVGGYYDLIEKSEEIELYGGKCRIMGVEDLIKAKKALGRHRDLVVVEELEAILKEKKLGSA